MRGMQIGNRTVIQKIDVDFILMLSLDCLGGLIWSQFQVMGVGMAVDLSVTVYAVELSMDITCNHSLYVADVCCL